MGKTENLRSPHSEGLKSVKIPQILRLAILGDTGIYLVVSALLAAYFLKNLSFFLVSPMSAKENFVLRTIVLQNDITLTLPGDGGDPGAERFHKNQDSIC